MPDSDPAHVFGGVDGASMKSLARGASDQSCALRNLKLPFLALFGAVNKNLEQY